MTNIHPTENTIPPMITANAFPAILVGGPPCAGKSTLTYNLTRELRRRNIPHFVFRANPDIEGDWFLEGDLDTVRQIREPVLGHRDWSDEFRDMICRDLSRRRHLPLIVDLGGRPSEKDHCIFRACTHSILLLKEGPQDTEKDKEKSRLWREIVKANTLSPLAEVASLRSGKSTLTASKPVIQGTLTGMERGKRIHGPVYAAIIDCVDHLFSSYPDEVLEKRHLESALIEYGISHDSVVNLPRLIRTITSHTEDWTPDLLDDLLANVPADTEVAIYGRAPCWVYGALALHSRPQQVWQFDAVLGWVRMPTLQKSTSGQLMQNPLHIYTPIINDDQFFLLMHPVHNYLDYTEAGQLEFPQPPPNHGVIVSGKLPLWLFTALARFYAQWDVPWIALNEARTNEAVVIYSKVESLLLGDLLPTPV